ncbi:MAG TPA: hypothetical protein VM573_09275 [Actinomycetota bacterium]|nr:hypothetical protein [Actinomycetota bacterium]
MTLLAAAAGVAAGAAVAALILPLRLARPAARLTRVNVDGREVPAVLAEPLVGGALLGLAAACVVAGGISRTAGAVAVVVAAMAAAGRYDDLRGDESARGFRGHLGAGRVTGGLVKIAAGVLAGALAGFVLWGGDPPTVATTTLLVALTANLINLLDRAPGRAAKVWLLLGLPLFAASPAWAAAAGGAVGASALCLVPDLRARAMLGDAGANPLGAAAGVGLAVALSQGGRIAAIALLLVLNAASEVVSFSRVIERVPWLRFVDRIGRE